MGILGRFEAFTGKRTRLAETGTTFEDVPRLGRWRPPDVSARHAPNGL